MRGEKRRKKHEALQHLLRSIRNLSNEEYRCAALVVLAPYLPTDLLSEAQGVAAEIYDSYYRTEALTSLIPHLPTDLLPETLIEAAEADDSHYRAGVLAVLSTLLPPDLMRDALAITAEIDDSHYRAEALTALISHLPTNLMPEAVATVAKIRTVSPRIQALSALMPHLSHDLLPKALTVATEIRHHSGRLQALTALLPHLPESLLNQALTFALDAARQTQYKSAVTESLATLSRYLPPDLIPEAFILATQMEESSDRAEALVSLSPYLPSSLLNSALNIARELLEDNLNYGIHVLASLAPRLPSNLFAEALDIARGLHADLVACSEVLAALAPHLPPEVLSEALSVAYEIRTDARAFAMAIVKLIPKLPKSTQYQAVSDALSACLDAEILGELAPYFSLDLWTRALAIVTEIKDVDIHRSAEALTLLAPYLPSDLFPKALEIARQLEERMVEIKSQPDYIYERDVRIDCLSGLAPHLPTRYFAECLAICYRIEEPLIRASALTALAPHLPSSLFLEAFAYAYKLQYEEDAGTEALIALVSNLPSEYFTKVLIATRGISYGRAFNKAFAALAPHLPPKLFNESLTVVNEIEDDFARTHVLNTLATDLQPDLSLNIVSDSQVKSSEFRHSSASRSYSCRNFAALRIIKWSYSPARKLVARVKLTDLRKIQWSYARARKLVALVPNLPIGLLPEALAITRELEYGTPRASVLVALAPRLSHELLSEALIIAGETDDAGARAQALAALAPYLHPELFPEALIIAGETEEAGARAQALAALAPHLPFELLSEALKITFKTKDGAYPRSLLLAYLLPLSPLNQRTKILQELLESTEEIPNKIDRIESLLRLVQILPGEKQSKVWEKIFSALQKLIDDEWIRVLASRAAVLPSDLLHDAIHIYLSMARRKVLDRIQAEKEDRGEGIVQASAEDLSPSILAGTIASLDALTEIEPAPRYADFTFYYDVSNSLGQKLPAGHILKASRWYQLEISVREKPTGIPAEEEKRRPIREPRQKKPVTVMVTIESVSFEIEEPVQTLLLPPLGNALENAYFRVRPIYQSASRYDLSAIRVRLYYQFNLLEVAVIHAEVAGEFDDPSHSKLGLEEIVTFKQERLEHEYIDFDETEPRAMHIDITKQDNFFQFNFAFYKDIHQKVEFTAPVRLSAADLEDTLINIRKIWYDIATSKTFTEKLEGDEDEFLVNIRLLAREGHKLWTRLFKLEIESSMYQIGEWLDAQPLEHGAIIQVSLEENAKDFVFPWALLYDREIPRKEYILPDTQGFWGLRYCIEQHLPRQVRGTDKPVLIGDKMKIGFMLWEYFRNADEQKLLMESLMAKSPERLEITMPPVVDVDKFFDLLDDCNDHILYFYTHGYTRHRQTDIGVEQNLALFTSRYERLMEEDPRRELWRFLYDSIKQEQFDPDRSWIELTYGKIFLDELYDAIDHKLRSQPFVFLNMCESAQVTPSLSDSFVHFFIDRGAKGVVGTECPMTVEFAHPFAAKFLGDLLTGEKAGLVLLNVRRYFMMEQKNPLGLAYSLFGLATVCFRPPPIATK